MPVSRAKQRVYKTEQAAKRRVPAVASEWAEEIADTVVTAFDSQGTSWGVDAMPPNGYPERAPGGGFIRKTDRQLQLMDLNISSTITVSFDNPDCVEEIVFNLRALADELNQAADSLQFDGDESEA